MPLFISRSLMDWNLNTLNKMSTQLSTLTNPSSLSFSLHFIFEMLITGKGNVFKEWLHLLPPLNAYVLWIDRPPIIKLGSPFIYRIFSSKMTDLIKIKLEEDSLVPPSCGIFLEHVAWKSAFFLQDPSQSLHPFKAIGCLTNLFLFISLP